MKACPFCAEEIQDAAIVCRFCQRDLRPGAAPTISSLTAQTTPAPTWSPGVAAVCSFFVPGLGQIYKGQIFAGLLWLIAAVIGYLMLIVPGLIVHLICIVNAYSGGASGAQVGASQAVQASPTAPPLPPAPVVPWTSAQKRRALLILALVIAGYAAFLTTMHFVLGERPTPAHLSIADDSLEHQIYNAMEMDHDAKKVAQRYGIGESTVRVIVKKGDDEGWSVR